LFNRNGGDMDILNIHPEIDDIDIDRSFTIILESHLTYLKTKGDVSLLPVTEHQGDKYEGDLYGLLSDLKVKSNYHYLIMRMNGYDSSSDYKGTTQGIIVPDYKEVNLLKNIYLTKSDELA
jgi:hypothetical protein